MANHIEISVISSSISLSLPTTASNTESPATPRLSSRSLDSSNGISLPASDSAPLSPGSSSAEESGLTTTSSASGSTSASSPTEPSPSPSMPIKNPAADPPSDGEEKPVSASSSEQAPSPTRTGTAPTSKDPAPPPPEASQRSSSTQAPPPSTNSVAPSSRILPASTPQTNTPATPTPKPPSTPRTTSVSNTPLPTSATARVVGAIGQESTSQTRSTITRTITDEPESTFSRPVSVTLTDPTNGQTSVSAPPFVTVLSTSTEPDGSYVTFTHVIANPTDIGATNTALGSQSILNNRGAAAGIFISVGIAAAVIAVIVFFICRRRRRRLRRERWLTGIQRPLPPSDPFDDPSMMSVHVADNVTRSANGRNLLDDELRSSISSSQPMISRPQAQSSGEAGRGAHGQGIINPFDSEANHPHTNIGLAITSDHYANLQRQSRASPTPSTPSMYPASLAPSDKDVDSLYERESSNAHQHPNIATPQPRQGYVAPPPLTIPIPTTRRNPPPQIPPRSLSRPKSAKLSDYNPFTPTSLTPPSSVSSHSKPNTPTDSESGRPLVHIWDEHTTASHENTNQYPKSPVDVLTRRTLLDVRPRVHRDTFGSPLS